MSLQATTDSTTNPIAFVASVDRAHYASQPRAFVEALVHPIAGPLGSALAPALAAPLAHALAGADAVPLAASSFIANSSPHVITEC